MEQNEVKTTAIKRVFDKDGKIPSDLFKLEMADMSKNIGFDDKNPIWQAVPHVHFFHTRCSDGKVQTACSAVGGHKHEMKVEYNKNGEVISAVCGPCSNPGRDPIHKDTHTHEVTYLQSSEVNIRVRNSDAQMFLANQANKGIK
jgi:hypothetical protein